ncbi:esterase family protein [Curtobacterium sp. MCBA15_001]|uniref:alpha/beta hydrolase n=1 Tax=Curtobacterium sp. MCBA15_001 TaxID=1898731 RepID=UPI0009F36FA2|nr:alpha/beta hydrolase-fold protein [Curtobacterium sp. MCBA15_001]
MFNELLRMPIVTPDVLVPVDVLAAVLALLTLFGRRRGLLVRLVALVVGAGLGLLAVWWFGDVRDEFGVAFTPVTRMWIALAAGAIVMGLVVLVQRGLGGRAWGRRGVAVAAMLAVTLAAGLGVNVDFGAYRTIDQAITTNPYPNGSLGHEHAAAAGATVVDAATWTAPAGMPRTGKAMSFRIPGKVSHFRARKAVVWLPPAALTADPPTLPVLVTFSGQPGQPSDMFQAGGMGRYLDAYAAAHRGLAPIVVAPDQLGAPNRNPMCLDSRQLGRSATYVMTDTVNWIKDHLNVGTGPSAWGVDGFSEGATCAMQFSAEHPDVFGSTLAVSSELAPFTGSAQHSAQVAFHGSMAKYAAAAPIAVMHRNAPYRDHLTVFGFGQDDAPYRATTAKLRAAAEQAGMQTQVIVSPGSAHDWNTVRYVLAHGLPPVIAHLGLPAQDGAL